MTGVVHVVARVDDDTRALALATALHEAGRPQLVVAGEASAHAERTLGARLRIVRSLRGLGDDVRLTRLVADAAALIEIQRVLDTLVDRLRSPIVIQTYPGKAGALARLAVRSIRGALCVHAIGDGASVHGDEQAVPLGALGTSGADIVVAASGVDDGRRRVIVDGIDPAPYAALLGGDVARKRARGARGVAAGAHVVVTNAVRAAQLWRSRDPRGDVLPFALDPPASARDALLVADAAVFVDAPLRDVLAALAAGLPVVVVGRDHEAQLAWCKRARVLPADATPEAIADALAAAIGARPLAASTRARHARLPRELTAAGALAAWSELYDELIGPPRPTGKMARRRPRRARR